MRVLSYNKAFLPHYCPCPVGTKSLISASTIANQNENEQGNQIYDYRIYSYQIAYLLCCILPSSSFYIFSWLLLCCFPHFITIHKQQIKEKKPQKLI